MCMNIQMEVHLHPFKLEWIKVIQSQTRDEDQLPCGASFRLTVSQPPQTLICWSSISVFEWHHTYTQHHREHSGITVLNSRSFKNVKCLVFASTSDWFPNVFSSWPLFFFTLQISGDLPFCYTKLQIQSSRCTKYSKATWLQPSIKMHQLRYSHILHLI